MKNNLLLLFFVTINISLAIAQTPSNIITRFKTDFPDANAAEWKLANDRYEVAFTDKKNLHHTVVYDKNGNVYSRESELDESSIPAAIKEYYAKNYPQQMGGRVWLSENEGGTKTYYSPVDDAVIFFDKDGKFTRIQSSTPEISKPK